MKGTKRQKNGTQTLESTKRAQEKQKQEEKASNQNTDTNVLFYRMKDMRKEFPIKEIDGKMVCPFCKISVKNVKLQI